MNKSPHLSQSIWVTWITPYYEEWQQCSYLSQHRLLGLRFSAFLYLSSFASDPFQFAWMLCFWAFLIFCIAIVQLRSYYLIVMPNYTNIFDQLKITPKISRLCNYFHILSTRTINTKIGKHQNFCFIIKGLFYHSYS